MFPDARAGERGRGGPTFVGGVKQGCAAAAVRGEEGLVGAVNESVCLLSWSRWDVKVVSTCEDDHHNW